MNVNNIAWATGVIATFIFGYVCGWVEKGRYEEKPRKRELWSRPGWPFDTFPLAGFAGVGDPRKAFRENGGRGRTSKRRSLHAWLVDVLKDALTGFYEKTLRKDVSFCGHGYISATCSECARRQP